MPLTCTKSHVMAISSSPRKLDLLQKTLMYHKELKCKDILCQRSPRVLHTDNAFAERHCLRGVITPGHLQKPPIPQGFIQNQ